MKLKDNNIISTIGHSKVMPYEDRVRIITNFYDSTPPINYVDKDKIVGSIYIITNHKNGKQYIGQTKDFDRRVRDYTRYSNPNKTWSNHTRLTSMYRILRDEGIENFTIRRYYDCDSYKELAEKEHELILKYNTIVPNGYNLNLNTEYNHCNPDQKFVRIHKEEKDRADNTRKKANPVFIVDAKTRTIIMSDAGTLFSDAIDPEVERSTVHSKIQSHKKINGRYYIYPADNFSFNIETMLALTELNNYEYCFYASEISKGINYLLENSYNIKILRYEDNPRGFAFYSINEYLKLFSNNPLM